MYYQNILQGGHFSQTPYPQKDHFTVYPQKFVAIFSKVIFISYPHLCLPLRHLYACLLPPVLVRNRSSWRAASVAGAKLYFCAKTIGSSIFVQLFVQDLVAVQGTNCWRYSDWGPLKHAEGYVSCSPVGQWTGEELNRWIGERWI